MDAQDDAQVLSLSMGKGVVPTSDEFAGIDPVKKLLAENPAAAPVLSMMEEAFRDYVAGTPATRKLSSLNALVYANAALDWMTFLRVRADVVADVATALLAPLALSRPGMVQVLGVTTSVVCKAHHLVQRHYGADAKARIGFRRFRDPIRAITEGRDPVAASGAAEFRAWVAKHGPNPATWKPEVGTVDRPQGREVFAHSPERPGPVTRTGAAPTSPRMPGQDPPASVPATSPAEEAVPPLPGFATVGPDADRPALASTLVRESGEARPAADPELGRGRETIRKTGHSRFKSAG